MPDAIQLPLKLGRRPLRVDPRTLQYRDFAPSPWNPPDTYSWDDEHPGLVPAHMFLNDTYGDCVIAARANQTLRFEYEEQKKVLSIQDSEVKDEYFSETGGPDVGLDPIASLNAWRRDGWLAAGGQYFIEAWLQVHAQDRQQISEATIVGQGLQIGLRLPLSALDQINAGTLWDLVAGPRGEADSWGGHMVYLVGYDTIGVKLWTWGRVQVATWRWLASYSDFAALVIDRIDRVAVDHPQVETAELSDAIERVTGT